MNQISPPVSKKVFLQNDPSWTESGLNWAIFNESKNGLKEAKAIARFGTGKRKKVFIHSERFYNCILSQNQAV